MLFGDWSFAADAQRAIAAVRDPSNFHWSILTLFAIALTMYCNEIKAKNFKAVACAAMLYAIHWFYEIMNAVICHITGYALWTVSPESTSFILLIGVSAELSLMFSISGFTCKLLPEDKNLKILGMNNRVFMGIAMAAFCSVVEIFLAWTPAFIWVYPWWGAIPVFITTYIPFFVGAYLVYDMPPQEAVDRCWCSGGCEYCTAGNPDPLGYHLTGSNQRSFSMGKLYKWTGRPVWPAGFLWVAFGCCSWKRAGCAGMVSIAEVCCNTLLLLFVIHTEGG